MKALLTKEEAAEYLNCSIATIDRLVVVGKLQPVPQPGMKTVKGGGIVLTGKPARRIRFERTNLDQFITECRDESVPAVLKLRQRAVR